MGFTKKGCGLACCLALTMFMPTVFAKDFMVQVPVQEKDAASSAKDDFYLHVNGDWLKNAKIPPEEGRYDHFSILAKQTREQLKEITQEAVQKRQQGQANADEARIADFYACVLDQKGRNAAGLGKLAEPLRRIESATTIQEYAEAMTAISRDYAMGRGMAGGFSVSNNPQENDRYVVFIKTPAVALGREFMENEKNAVYHGYYRDYLLDLLVLYGRSPAEAEKTAADIFALEKDVALHSLTIGDRYDPSKSVHHLHLQDIRQLYPSLDAEAMLNAGGIGPANGIKDWYVEDTEAIRYVNRWLSADKLPLLKEQAICSLLKENASVLTMAYRQVFDRYRQQLSGAKVDQSAERKALECNESLLPQTYGRVYAAKYFDDQRRSQINGYLQLIMQQYKQKLNRLDWMSEATKQQAIKKLDHMDIHVGAPMAWPEYVDSCQAVRPEAGGSLIDNVVELQKLMAHADMAKIGQPVRRDLWEGMTPQTVNAYYEPQNNSINFPAAILQAPFFDSKADQATNLGGIGMVMAHEITHSFDSSGAQYDEQGRLHNWWTDQDYAEFKKRQAGIIKFYDQYVLTDGTRVNGTQTLTENIADLGALSCLTDIVGHDKEKLRRMYTNYAVTWQSKLSPVFLSYVFADVHSLPYVRVDAVLSSTDGFYEAYGVQPGDGMYVAPEDRAKLW